MPITILIADDEPHIRDVVRFALEQAGMRCLEAADGQQALHTWEAERPDLVVLDVKMPALSGTDVCRLLRARSTVPVVFLTSCDEEIDRIVGLEIGGDDYVTKPFSPRELVARIRAVLRRAPPPGAPEPDRLQPLVPVRAAAPPPTKAAAALHHGALRMDVERFEVWWGESRVELTVTEFGLLRALLERPGRVFRRDELMRHMYDTLTHVSDRTVDSHVRHIRSKLAAAGGDAVETVHGLGYRLGPCAPPGNTP